MSENEKAPVREQRFMIKIAPEVEFTVPSLIKNIRATLEPDIKDLMGTLDYKIKFPIKLDIKKSIENIAIFMVDILVE